VQSYSYSDEGIAMRRLLILSVLLSGCANKVPVITRFDGLTPTAAQQEQAWTECEAKSRVTSQMTHYAGTGGIAGAIATYGVQNDALTACMAEKGFKVAYVEAK
jgi:hypothetical protein